MKLNPFNPNSVVSTNLFAGREKYVLNIINKFEQVKKGMPSSFFLFGERGIGKTALAKLILYIAKKQDEQFGNLNFLVSYYSADKGQSINSILQESLNNLSDNISSNILTQLSDKLGSLLKNGKFSIGAFSVELKNNKEDTIIVRDQLISILSNLIDAIKNDIGDANIRKDGILIIIDEMQNVSDINICAQLLRGIITTLDVKNLGNISFLLIGYKEAMSDFFDGDQSARRQFDSVELGVMPLQEAKEVLVKGFKEANVKWDDNSLSKSIYVTGGYPHSIQLLGHNLIEVDNDNNINSEDWKQAINRTAFELRKKDFAEMYNFNGKTSAREKILDVLAIAAIAAKPLSKKEIIKYSKVTNVYQYLPDLIKKGCIQYDKKKEKISIHSQLFSFGILISIFNKIKNENYLNELLYDILDNKESD